MKCVHIRVVYKVTGQFTDKLACGQLGCEPFNSGVSLLANSDFLKSRKHYSTGCPIKMSPMLFW